MGSSCPARDGTGRRDSANPRRTIEPNGKLNVNCWLNLKSATKPLNKKFRSQATRTDENFPDIVRVSHQLFLSHAISPYAHTRTFLAAHARAPDCDHTFGSLAWRFVCVPHFIIGHVFVNVSWTPVSSFSHRLLHRNRINSLSNSALSGPSVHLADPIPNTGYEPSSASMSVSEHTPINLPTRNMGFQQEYDATITAFEDLHLRRHSGASSSSQHTQQADFPLCWNWVQKGPGSRKCRRNTILLQVGLAIMETCADTDRETVVSSLFPGLCPRWREIETKTLCKRWSPQKSLNGRLNLPFEEKTGSAMIIRIWCIFGGEAFRKETFRYCCLWDQCPNDYICNRWINGLIRLKERRWSCSEETNRARQARIDELSLHQEVNLRTVSQLLDSHFQDSLNKEFSLYEKLPRNWRITKNLLRRKRSNKTSKTWWIIYAANEGSFHCESIINSNSGFTEWSEFPVRCKRFSRSWDSEHL